MGPNPFGAPKHRCEDMGMTARDRLHRLVDKLPENKLETARRVLTEFSVPSSSASAAAKASGTDESVRDREAEKIEEGGHGLENRKAVTAERRMHALDRALVCNHPTGNIEEILADIERGRDLH